MEALGEKREEERTLVEELRIADPKLVQQMPLMSLETALRKDVARQGDARVSETETEPIDVPYGRSYGMPYGFVSDDSAKFHSLYVRVNRVALLADDDNWATVCAFWCRARPNASNCSCKRCRARNASGVFV